MAAQIYYFYLLPGMYWAYSAELPVDRNVFNWCVVLLFSAFVSVSDSAWQMKWLTAAVRCRAVWLGMVLHLLGLGDVGQASLPCNGSARRLLGGEWLPIPSR